MTSIRSLSELTAKLTARTAKVAGTAPVDPTSQGTVAIPKDPSTTPAAQNLPTFGANTGSTAVLNPPGTDTRPTIEPASLTDKAASVLASLKSLVKASPAPAPAPKSAGANGGLPPDAPQSVGDVGVPDKNKAATPSVNADAKGQAPADGTNKDETAGAGAKIAGQEEFDPEFARGLLCKLASTMLETEEGRAYAAQLLEQSAGAEAALDIVKAAAWAEDNLQSEARFEEEGALQAEAAWNSVSDEDRFKIIKLATTLDAARRQLHTPLELAEFNQGVLASVALLQQPKVAGALGLNPDDAGPVGGGGGTDPSADAPASAMGDSENPELPAVADEELDEEAVMEALQELVESGELEPEVAQEVVQALQEEAQNDAPAAPASADASADPALKAASAEAASAEEVPESLKIAATLTLAALQD